MVFRAMNEISSHIGLNYRPRSLTHARRKCRTSRTLSFGSCNYGMGICIICVKSRLFSVYWTDFLAEWMFLFSTKIDRINFKTIRRKEPWKTSFSLYNVQLFCPQWQSWICSYRSLSLGEAVIRFIFNGFLLAYLRDE